MSYTKEQIKEVCAKVGDAIADFTNVQNASFTSTPIIAGMNAGKTFEEINADMWAAIDKIPPLPDQYGLVGANAVNGNPMVNICKIASGALHQALESIQTNNTSDPSLDEGDDKENPDANPDTNNNNVNPDTSNTNENQNTNNNEESNTNENP